MERVIIVEYLDPSMSRDLLCKFPDPSPFDFDYDQSGIWSPLLPRHSYSMISIDGFPSARAERKKMIGGPEKMMLQQKLKKVSTKIVKAVKMTMFNSKKKKKMKSMKSLEFSPSPVPGSASRKGWSKVLRAATKRFKKHKGSSQQLKLRIP